MFSNNLGTEVELRQAELEGKGKTGFRTGTSMAFCGKMSSLLKTRVEQLHQDNMSTKW